MYLLWNGNFQYAWGAAPREPLEVATAFDIAIPNQEEGDGVLRETHQLLLKHFVTRLTWHIFACVVEIGRFQHRAGKFWEMGSYCSLLNFWFVRLTLFCGFRRSWRTGHLELLQGLFDVLPLHRV
jgi:hypothetical protein